MIYKLEKRKKKKKKWKNKSQLIKTNKKMKKKY
jgi:hypothetical protein